VKTLHALLTGALLLTPAVQVGAQTPASSPVARADAYGVVSWLNVQKPGIDRYDDWLNQLGTFGGGFGWYWTDNLKTEIDAEVSSTTERELYSVDVVDGRQIFSESDLRFSTRHLSIGQQYQFFRNVWFHPHLTAGVDLAWEMTERREGGVLNIVDPVARRSETVIQPETTTHRTELIARPYTGLGFKAYMSPRSFFRMDMRFILKDGVDEVLMRFGFGVDF
jgi:hypothetical protein